MLLIKKAWGNPLYSNAIYLIISNVAAAILGFAFWVIAARLYTTEEVGLASATIAAMIMLGTFSHLGLGLGLVRYLPGIDNDHKNSMINSSITLAVIISVIMAVIFILGVNIWTPDLILLRQNGIYFLMFVLFVTATAVATINDYTFIAQRRADYVAMRTVIFNVLKLVLVVILAGIVESYGIFTSWGIMLTLSLIGALLFLQPRLTKGYLPLPSFRWHEITDMIRFSFMNNINIILWSLPGWILPLIVLNRLGAEANAYFYIAWQINTAIITVSQSVATSLFSEGSHEDKGFGVKALNTLLLLILIMIPIVILAIFFSGKLLILFGNDYSTNSTRLLQILILAQIPLAVNLIYFSVLRVRKKLKELVILSLFVAVITLALSIILLPIKGITGAGIGWLCGQTILAIWIVIYTGWGISFIKKLVRITRKY